MNSPASTRHFPLIGSQARVGARPAIAASRSSDRAGLAGHMPTLLWAAPWALWLALGMASLAMVSGPLLVALLEGALALTVLAGVSILHASTTKRRKVALLLATSTVLGFILASRAVGDGASPGAGLPDFDLAASLLIP
jgi:hypothetical protein